MPTLDEHRAASRVPTNTPHRTADEIQALAEPYAQRSIRYRQAQATSASALAEDPARRDALLRAINKDTNTVQDQAIADLVKDDEDPYDVLRKYDSALKVAPSTFEEHFKRMNDAIAATAIYNEILRLEISHDTPVWDAFQTRWRQLETQWNDELYKRNPMPNVSAMSIPTTPWASRPHVHFDPLGMTETEITALLADPLKLSSSTFRTTDEEMPEVFTVAVTLGRGGASYVVQYEDLPEELEYDLEDLRHLFLGSRRIDV